MRITALKINGISGPMGFSYPVIKCSWKVTDARDKQQEKAKISVSETMDFKNTVYTIEGRELSSIGTLLDMELKPYTRYYYRVEVWGESGDYGISEVAFFETGKMKEPWLADYIGMEEEDNFHPVFKKSFAIGNKVEKARIYITGLGLYEAYLNGSKIGEDYLAPFCNDYNKKIQYQTYDVTELLKAENELEIFCGNGWYKGRLGYDGDREFYGDKFGTIAELYMWDDTGNAAVVRTDGTWTYEESDIISSDIYDGETIDRRKRSQVGKKTVQKLEFDKSKLVERYSLPVLVKEKIKVKEVIHTPAGETVLDFGQNFAGFVSFWADFDPGTEIVLDFGEILQKGNFYNDNYRTAKSRFTYISDGRKEEVRPHFTYFGFRYVRVTGWRDEVRAEDFVGNVVYSDLDTTVKFDSSSKKLNRLYQNCLWGQKSNFIDMPTDCPQRDERLGWTGDAQVFSPTASFNMDTRAFYRKFLSDLHLEQLEHDGAVANYIPNNSKTPGGSSVWGDAATFIPMTVYEYFGDKEELENYYPMMKDWVEYIRRGDREHGDRHLWNFGFHFGDWLAQDGATPQSMKGGTDDGYVASMYYYASVKKLSEAAAVLGRQTEEEEYEKLSEEIRQAVLKEYFSENGRLCIDTQTGYLLALRFEIYKEKQRIIDGLRTRLKKDCYKIKGGFVGATMMCQVMAANGLEDLAYYILFQEGFPGWLHCVNLGATTIWERWNSVLDDGTVSGTGMNSLNHYSYGSVMEYVYRYIGGINETAPGFKKVRFAPQLSSKLSRVHFEYDSVSGNYVSDWKVEPDGKVTVHFEVPFGCTATAVLPGTNGQEIRLTAGSFEKTYQPKVDYRKKYTMSSRLEEMKTDEQAMAILQRELPIAAEMIASGDPESLSMSLEELQFMFFMGFNPEMVQKAATHILEISVNLEQKKA